MHVQKFEHQSCQVYNLSHPRALADRAKRRQQQAGKPLTPYARSWQSWLRADSARSHREEVRVDWEADVDEGDEDGHHVTNVDGLVVVSLRNVGRRRWHSLGPH